MENHCNRPHIIDIGKGISLLNLSVTTAKDFQTSDIICFPKSTIVSTLFTTPCVWHMSVENLLSTGPTPSSLIIIRPGVAGADLQTA